MSDGMGAPPAQVRADVRAQAADSARAGRPLLSLALASMMEEVQAHSGAVYLMAADQPVLEMAVAAGLPRVFAAPWERVGLSAPIPVAEAVRERRLVWVGGEEDMARRYPRIAVVLPYPFALAALPVATAETVFGALYVTWPGAHPTVLSDREREVLTAGCDRLAVRLERAARENRAPWAEPEPPEPAPMPSATGQSAMVEAARRGGRLP